jgi:prephenate dehydrogenase
VTDSASGPLAVPPVRPPVGPPVRPPVGQVPGLVLSGLPTDVLVVGVGLLGTSIALALATAGTKVYLNDVRSEAVRTAVGLGAGERYQDQQVGLVVIAVPPRATGPCIRQALADHADAIVTDVSSVKVEPLLAVGEHPGRERYVGSHPMAGSERSGPLASSAVLFEGRPWAITPHESAAPEAISVVSQLAQVCGGIAVTMTPTAHDQAVARTSHLPYLLSVVTAGQLVSATEDQLKLAGPGVRDVTRVAASDTSLWTEIIAANQSALIPLLQDAQNQIHSLISSLQANDVKAAEELLGLGVRGTQRLPGRHGGPHEELDFPDHPGELARLFAVIGEIGTNIEDIRIDHDPGRPVGLAEVAVASGEGAALGVALESRGWLVHG